MLRRSLILTIALLSLVISGGTPSWASHSGDANSGIPDNADHYIDRVDLNAVTNNGVIYGEEQLDGSDLNVTFSGSGDVWIYDSYYNDPVWAGLTTCYDETWTGRCDKYEVKIDLENVNGSNMNARYIACHELGHTGGLGHRSASNDSNGNSCMRSDLWGVWDVILDNHDDAAINDVV
jgi:hypothetical protein